MKFSNTLSIGFAIFCMFFGAGNIAWPMILGRAVGQQVWFGILGFIVVGVIIPLLGLVSVMLCDGDYKKLLGKMGHVPAQITAFACIMMMGPFMGIARCVIIAHASIHLYIPTFNLFLFSIFSCMIIYIVARKPSSIVDILGRFLGPIKLFLLLGIIIAGLYNPQILVATNYTPLKSFLQGMYAGSMTGDLLGSIFFSGLILVALKKALHNHFNYKKLAIAGLKTGSIGALMLGSVYAGFCLVAAFYSNTMNGVERVNVFSVLADLVLGNLGGLCANMTIALACLTTAIALAAIFAEYLSKDLLNNKINYHSTLIITIITTIIASNLGFNAITDYFAGPMFSALYPALIVLSLVNIANVLWGFTWMRTPVFLTFIVSIGLLIF